MKNETSSDQTVQLVRKAVKLNPRCSGYKFRKSSHFSHRPEPKCCSFKINCCRTLCYGSNMGDDQSFSVVSSGWNDVSSFQYLITLVSSNSTKNIYFNWCSGFLGIFSKNHPQLMVIFLIWQLEFRDPKLNISNAADESISFFAKFDILHKRALAYDLRSDDVRHEMYTVNQSRFENAARETNYDLLNMLCSARILSPSPRN